MTSVISRAAGASLALAGAIAMSGAPASAAPLGGHRASAAHDGRAVTLVSDDWDDRRHRRHRHYFRDYDGDHVVDAPYTHVETGYGGRVAVDAPYASVRVGRRGVWVRAPFVDLYVPKY